MSTNQIPVRFLPDPARSHDRLKVKFTLLYALLGEPDHRVSELYST